MSAVLDPRAWSVSVAVHATAIAVFAVLLGAGHEDHDSEEAPPARLVWVEPAAPRLGDPAASPAIERPAPAAPAPAPLARTRRPKPAPRPAARRETRSGAAPVSESSAAPASDGPAAPSGAAVGTVTAASSGTARGAADVPLAVGAVAAPPELLERVMPEYPVLARDREVEGHVVLEVILDRQGRPEPDIKVRRSIALLDAAAIAAVRQWRFRPARDADGKPVRVILDVPVRFELR